MKSAWKNFVKSIDGLIVLKPSQFASLGRDFVSSGDSGDENMTRFVTERTG